VTQAVGEQLPFRNKAFSGVVLVVTLCFVDDPLRVLREAHRLLLVPSRTFVLVRGWSAGWRRRASMPLHADPPASRTPGLRRSGRRKAARASTRSLASSESWRKPVRRCRSGFSRKPLRHRKLEIQVEISSCRKPKFISASIFGRSSFRRDPSPFEGARSGIAGTAFTGTLWGLEGRDSGLKPLLQEDRYLAGAAFAATLRPGRQEVWGCRSRLHRDPWQLKTEIWG
jgi:SAM-dependent methyltransferase